VSAVAAAPLGLDGLPFLVVGLGMGYVIAVAEFVAGRGGAVIGVPAGPPASLGLIAFGGLVVVLWVGRGRWAGLAPVALGVLLWAGHPRPDLLIADTGRLFGIATPAGRVLSSGTGNGFAAGSWLEDDGDLATQVEAYARGGLVRRRHRIEAEVPGLGPLLYIGTREMAGAEADCGRVAVLIAPNWQGAPSGECLFVGRTRLRRDGAIGVRLTPEGAVVTAARDGDGRRPWAPLPDAPALTLARR
jgi:competence protein ComEC